MRVASYAVYKHIYVRLNKQVIYARISQLQPTSTSTSFGQVEMLLNPPSWT